VRTGTVEEALIAHAAEALRIDRGHPRRAVGR
jgi:hypothetical protein